MLHFIAVIFVVGGFLLFGSLRLPGIRRHSPDERAVLSLNAVQGALKRALRAAGVTLYIEGLENIPENEAVLFIGNHRSFFDVVIAYTLVKGPTGFIAKEELSRIPLLRSWMEELGCRFLKRGDVKQNLKVVLAAIKDVKDGKSVWIYPEGTRSEDSDELNMLPFKDGSFKIAEKSGCRIVPVAMLNTRDIFEADFPRVHPTRVRIKIGTPILLSELSGDERNHIGEYMRDKIKGYLSELRGISL